MRTPGPGAPPLRWPERPWEVSGALGEVLRRAEAECDRAPALWAELEPLSHPQRLLRVTNTPRFATLGLVKHLLGLAGGGVAPAEELARLALGVAAALPAGAYPRAVVCDLQAHAWGLVAGAAARRGDPTAAEAAVGRGWGLLAAGTGDALEQAHLLEREAGVLRCQGREAEAEGRLRRAAALHRQVGNQAAAEALERAAALGPGSRSMMGGGSESVGG